MPTSCVKPLSELEFDPLQLIRENWHFSHEMEVLFFTAQLLGPIFYLQDTSYLSKRVNIFYLCLRWNLWWRVIRYHSLSFKNINLSLLLLSKNDWHIFCCKKTATSPCDFTSFVSLTTLTLLPPSDYHSTRVHMTKSVKNDNLIGWGS